MAAPVGFCVLKEGARLHVQGDGVMHCVAYPPRLDPIPLLEGKTKTGAYTVDLAPYQKETNCGPIQWTLVAADALLTGMRLDPTTGKLTFADGFTVTSSGDGSIQVYTTGVAGRSNAVPLALNITSNDTVNLPTVMPTLSGDTTVAPVTLALAPLLLPAGGMFATPLTWSLEGEPPRGITFDPVTATLTADVNTNTVIRATVTINVTDRLGVKVTRSVPLAVRAAIKARYVRIRRTVGDDYMNIAEISAFHGTQMHQIVSGSVVPVFGNYDWNFLADNNTATFAHTDRSPTAVMTVDLGADFPIDRLLITNRIDLAPDLVVQNRIIGSTVTVETSDGVVLYTRFFSTTGKSFDLPVAQLYPYLRVPPMNLVIPPTFTGNTTAAAVTMGMLAYLYGMYATPVVWSLGTPVAGITIDPNTGILTAAIGTKATGSITVTVTDKNGKVASRVVAVQF
jgi:hypothetical protein